MNPLREELLKNLEKFDKELFDKIENNPHPNPLELWALSEDRFVQWRRLNDFPKLLTYFDNTFLEFNKWKIDNKLTNQIIIDCGIITPFLEKKKFTSVDKWLYLILQKGENFERTVVSRKKMDYQKDEIDDYSYKTILRFTSYLDWLASRGKYQEILMIKSRHSPRSEYERVFINTDLQSKTEGFELLKMGGFDIPVDGFKILNRGKKLEFANLCGLKLSGEMYFGDMGNLSCSFCACDNWIANNLNLSSLRFEHCFITNFNMTNSKIQQWSFYNCVISGDFYDTTIRYTRIIGGSFYPVFHDCVLFDVDIDKQVDKAIPNSNLYAYLTFKKIYADQGNEDKAKEYFIKENEFIRDSLTGLRFILKSLSYYYWEYGRKPHRIIVASLMIILFCSVFYYFNSNLICSSKIQKFTFIDGLYFSATTFTTLGYGDLAPLGWLRILTSMESLSGLVNMGFLIAGYSNNKY